MKNKWLSFFSGKVQLEVKGKGIERLLNECTRNGIALYAVKKKKDCVLLMIQLQDVHAFRRAIRNHECKASFKKRKGLPFLLLKSKLNMGFTAGFAVFFIILFLLSNMVWKIDIKGAKPETEHQMMKHLEEIGVEKGRLQFLMMTPEKIQKSLTNGIENITWVGVELNGTSLHMKVVEKNEPTKEKYISPRHIVAKKKAIITRMFVQKGQPMAFVNDHVEKGQLLVSGLIGSEDHQHKVASKAEIYGETWYKSNVTVPLETSFTVYTGKVRTKHKLAFGSLAVPFWGFSFKEEPLKNPKTEQENHPFQFLGLKLPISYVKEQTRESEPSVRTYTKEQAVKAGIKMGKQDVEKQLGDSGEVKSEKVLHQSVENGKVKLIILYQVIEDIVQTTPIVQGD
ncbi:stage IV sporulation protein [Bacillus nakamurai]|uniref:Stage IV sporulation protein n=1 Tax=Bacillus nakamurai TaxID=1793963 RepID=A0A150F6G4_9BACI|nr:sporulation protein YqfD [Bacillus nakamurai]KXZ18456.1 stage IV sporulation protein [Bacillus nakamurai]KXZ23122.1 stage IV sporulation protein [Bacillus nakamurai]MED1229514.1 sporulation protein YqfD [Bacillus nakamurai]